MVVAELGILHDRVLTVGSEADFRSPNIDRWVVSGGYEVQNTQYGVRSTSLGSSERGVGVQFRVSGILSAMFTARQFPSRCLLRTSYSVLRTQRSATSRRLTPDR